MHTRSSVKIAVEHERVMLVRGEDLARIESALDEAATAISGFVPGAIEFGIKSGDDPVTQADRISNLILHAALTSDGDGWLSEESTEDLSRLHKRRVWIVDPLDGTREFVQGIPEWCISVALVEDGQAVAGGICNPATGERFVGGVGWGLTYNGRPACCTRTTSLSGATVLASRSEVKRGEWDEFETESFTIQPVGSVAYKLARVAAGLADATWTLCPKHEWDVAAGVALIRAGGGAARILNGSLPVFNAREPLLPHLVASGSDLADALVRYLCQRRGVMDA